MIANPLHEPRYDTSAILAYWLNGIDDKGPSESGEMCIVADLFGGEVRGNTERY